MTDGLWWLPSLIVFGSVGVGIVVIARVAAGRRRRLGSGVTNDLAALEQEAGVALVRADDLVHAAEDEVDFARAEFGDAAAREFSAAMATARDQLREAFQLHQQLADAIPDSDSQRRRWARRIAELCGSVTSTVLEQTGRFDDRRAVERNAPDRLSELRQGIAASEDRLTEAEATIDRLTGQVALSAVAPVTDAPSRARAALSRAHTALQQAETRVSAREVAADVLDDAAQSLLAARHALDDVTRTATALDAASRELDAAIQRGRAALDEARRRRDTAELPEAAADISAGIDILTDALARGSDRNELPDPLARLDIVRDAETRLDAALSSARTRQQRIDSAREALRGALFSARSHLEVASTFIAGNRGRVGPDARTRLAEAERQLALAEAADDPVDALDTARRVSRLAQDAEALARYDVGPTTAPYRS
ncbi:chromosome segregation ATPase [Mycetocola sp. CAN_C7]|uniref:hypothetical protein n=1 Tax=Mycetocola sp. CAN_C7 TaxID=2787724 RepID=UPI0018CA7708